MINVYPSVLSCDPVETHEAGGVTVGQWMSDNVPGYAPGDNQPVSVTVNGDLLAPRKWANTAISAEDSVDVRVQPAGVNLFTAFVTIREGFRPIVNALTPDIPNQPGQGSALDFANARGNTARLGQAVPECFGSVRRYPDYLLPPRRFFNEPRSEWMELFLCIGRGDYEIPISGVMVGDTPLTALGANSEFTVYPPNDDLSAEAAAEWWHSVAEVGSTSSGRAGVELGPVSNVSDYPEADSFTFSGDSISIPDGAGSFPAGWDNTLTVRVEQYLDYEIEAGSPRDIIRGRLDQLGAFPGMVIEIAGDNSGIYVVETFTASVPDNAGAASTLKGSASPARYDFDVTPASFSVALNGNSQGVTLNTNLVDFAGLLVELNSQLNATIQAQDEGTGKVELVEQGPNYSGVAITLSGTTTDVFGVAPVGATGDETTVASQAEMTLSYESGDPVSGLTPNAGRMAIGYRGLLYLVDGATTSEIELTRLDDQGGADSGWPGFDNVTTTDAVIFVTGTSAQTGWAGPFAACPEGEETQRVQLDFIFPQGLAYIKDSGSVRANGQTVQVRWRESGSADPWNLVNFGFGASTLNQIGFTEYLDLPSAIRPEISVRRVGPGSSGSYRSDVVWYGLRSKLEAPSSYPWTTIAVRIKDSNKLSGQSENKISVLANRVIPVLSGGNWQPAQETRDIAPVARYIAQSIGYSDSQLGMDELERLDGVWKARGDHFDMVFSETTVSEALKTVLRAGMSELTIDQGRIQPVRDEIRTTFESGQGYSPQNMTGPLSRSFQSRRPDDSDGVDVEFTNRTSWTKETIECRLPGDLGLKVEKIRLDGVTDRDQAYQIGMRRRSAMRWRRWEYSFETEMDGLNSNYMSYVPILDDLPKYGQSSIMVGIDDDGGGNAKITVTEPMDWSDSGASYVVAYRQPDGTVAGPYPATQGADEYEIIAPAPLPWPDLTARQEPPHVYFGTTANWCFPALITSIRPRGMLNASITATNYDERVYQYDDATPPA